LRRQSDSETARPAVGFLSTLFANLFDLFSFLLGAHSVHKLHLAPIVLKHLVSKRVADFSNSYGNSSTTTPMKFFSKHDKSRICLHVRWKAPTILGDRTIRKARCFLGAVLLELLSEATELCETATL